MEHKELAKSAVEVKLLCTLVSLLRKFNTRHAGSSRRQSRLGTRGYYSHLARTPIGSSVCSRHQNHWRGSTGPLTEHASAMPMSGIPRLVIPRIEIAEFAGAL